MCPKRSKGSPSQFKSFEKNILYFVKTLEAKSENSKKLSEEIKFIVQNDMMKFSTEVRNSLTQVYRDFKEMFSNIGRLKFKRISKMLISMMKK